MATKRAGLEENNIAPLPTARSVTAPQGTPVNQNTGTPNSKYPTVSYRVDPAVVKDMRLLSVDLERPIGELVQEAFTRLLDYYKNGGR